MEVKRSVLEDKARDGISLGGKLDGNRVGWVRAGY